MGTIKKKELLKTLLGVATADGAFGLEEQEAIASVMAHLGLTESPSETELPESSQDKVDLFRSVLKVAYADNVLTENERSFVEKLATDLGLTQSEYQTLRAEFAS